MVLLPLAVIDRHCSLQPTLSQRVYVGLPVRLLDVTISSDLSMDKHVATVCSQWKLLLALSAEESPTFIR